MKLEKRLVQLSLILSAVLLILGISPVAQALIKEGSTANYNYRAEIDYGNSTNNRYTAINANDTVVMQDRLQLNSLTFTMRPTNGGFQDPTSLNFKFKPIDTSLDPFNFMYSSVIQQFTKVVDSNTRETIANVSPYDRRTGFNIALTEDGRNKDSVTIELKKVDLSFDFDTFKAYWKKHPKKFTPETQGEFAGRSYVDIPTAFYINDELIETFTLRYYTPAVEIPDIPIRKWGKYMGDKEFKYQALFYTSLANSNEFVIYDTADVNLHYQYSSSIEFASMYAAGQIQDDMYASLTNGYYNFTKKNSDKTAAEPGDVQLYVYDVYFVANRNREANDPDGALTSRQALYVDKTIPLISRDRYEPNTPLTSISTAAVPDEILFEKPSGEALTTDELARINATERGGATGFSTAERPGAVGKGVKFVFLNLPKNADADKNGEPDHQFYRVSYKMDVKHVPANFVNGKGEGLYWNSMSYYFQEIPNCGPEDRDCPKLKSVKSLAEESNKTVTRGLVVKEPATEGSISGSTTQNKGLLTVKYFLEGTDSEIRDAQATRGEHEAAYNLASAPLKEQFMPAVLTANGRQYEYVGLRSGELSGTFDKMTPKVVELNYRAKTSALTAKYRLKGTADGWLKEAVVARATDGTAYDIAAGTAAEGMYFAELESAGKQYRFVGFAEGEGLAAAAGSYGPEDKLVVLEYELVDETPEEPADPTEHTKPEEPGKPAEQEIPKPTAAVKPLALPKTSDLGLALSAMLAPAAVFILAAKRIKK